MENNQNIDNDDISIESLKKLLTSSNGSSIFDDIDISKAIEDSEILVRKNIDDLMNQFKDYKTEIYFVNKSNNPDPSYAHKGDSGFDLRANLIEDNGQMNIEPLERYLIPTGLYFEIPKGYDMEIKSRSGLAVKNGIMILTGTIDQNYRGEVKVLLYNTSKEIFTINHGDRIAQAIIRPVISSENGILTKISELNASNRMDNGFGSSGVK
jgi:dUTP pyrophosphatase